MSPDAAESDKITGIILAVISSFLIGSSFILTKMGLQQASRNSSGVPGESFDYLKNYMWWAGLISMILGEASNFAAYSFAPAILVTPLGAGSVFISAILASFFLNEHLTTEGKIGCALCLLGSVVIILNAPEEEDIISVDQILEHATNPGFVVYMTIVSLVSIYLIYQVGPIYGSISVMAAKAFGIAIKLSIEGNNQFTYLSTYLFGITVFGCAITQINYFNKALDLFSTTAVTPIYYVMFTTATIVASVILFEGINKATPVSLTTVLIGFITIFIGVFMVNSSKSSKSVSSNPLSRSASRHSVLEEIAMKPLVQTTAHRTGHDAQYYEDEDQLIHLEINK